MKLKQLFTDDDAVSPVIGVILMVAITVILAAVIASFVLGLGNSTGTDKPTASFSQEYTKGETVNAASHDGNGGYIEISHNNGDTIKAQTLTVKGSDLAIEGDGSWEKQFSDTSDSAGKNFGSTSDITSGDSIYVNTNSNAYNVKLVWSPLEEDTSKKFLDEDGPAA